MRIRKLTFEVIKVGENVEPIYKPSSSGWNPVPQTPLYLNQHYRIKTQLKCLNYKI
jgi:hypothetical protein